ncbi:hypothetical protein KDAU_21100 [Dictyobacter aurantiacus]|uniref:Uncharacterized protein n=2 Tax=Dictyobacter aurantiacus TaxID=1936993 RepID=A0A401ZD13_9CHLR|nr:hypothetical protein KDAU_21100 [Dictyobacter aurantiacus]
MSPLLLGALSIFIILFVFLAIGNKKDTISWLIVLLGVVAIVLILLHFNDLNHLAVIWRSKFPFWDVSIAQK